VAVARGTGWPCVVGRGDLIMAKPENSWKRWTHEETELLVSMAKQGIKNDALAISFGRSEDSIRKKLAKVEHRTPVVRSKRIVEKKMSFWQRIFG
jgi:hypothetical protein